MQAVIVTERLLQRVQRLSVGRKTLDRGDLMPVRLHGEHQARARGEVIEQDRAGAADAVLAAEMRAGEAEAVAQEIGERQPHLDLVLVALAVDGQRDLACLAHPNSAA